MNTNYGEDPNQRQFSEQSLARAESMEKATGVQDVRNLPFPLFDITGIEAVILQQAREEYKKILTTQRIFLCYILGGIAVNLKLSEAIDLKVKIMYNLEGYPTLEAYLEQEEGCPEVWEMNPISVRLAWIDKLLEKNCE